MCGIVGIASTNRITKPELLQEALAKLKHRGPDASGVWLSSNQKVTLGHNRLAILDLTDHGNQPMHDASNKIHLTFNGEIYNYKALKKELQLSGVTFQSHTDTEVVLEAYKRWGTDCLSRIEGMFAFGLYDENMELLFLARDRAGEKPLYYSFTNGQIIFSSEIKGIFAVAQQDRQVDLHALQSLLFQGFVKGDKSIYQEIQKLPPAHALRYDLSEGEISQWRYWHLPKYQTDRQLGESELLERLEEKLKQSVRQQLQADVPVGILLSGGVDSSLITAMAAQLSGHVKTYNVSFPGQHKFNESAHARLVAHHFGTDHTEIEASQMTPEILLQMASEMDEPMIDSSILPTYLVSQEIAKYGKVALGGDGADEVFGGYYHYSYLQKLQQLSTVIPLPIRKFLSATAHMLLPLGVRGGNWMDALRVDLRNELPFMYAHFDDREQQKFLRLKKQHLIDIEKDWQAWVPEEKMLLSRSMRMDFSNYLPEDILVKVDRASMMNSLEIRAPFLDHHVVEFAFEYIPESLKATPQKRKILLKNMGKKLLPETFDWKRKQGFSIPLSAWLKEGEWRTFFKDELFSGQQDLFDHKYINRLFRDQDRGLNNSERLYALLMIHLWRKAHQPSFGDQL